LDAYAYDIVVFVADFAGLTGAQALSSAYCLWLARSLRYFSLSLSLSVSVCLCLIRLRCTRQVFFGWKNPPAELGLPVQEGLVTHGIILWWKLILGIGMVAVHSDMMKDRSLEHNHTRQAGEFGVQSDWSSHCF
jgi:hypothetical protein